MKETRKGFKMNIIKICRLIQIHGNKKHVEIVDLKYSRYIK